MKVVVVGAGVGGLTAALRLAVAGHEVTVFEQSGVPGGKAGRWEKAGFVFDTGPSLLTMPWVLRDLFADTGAPLEDELALVRVEPVTRYRFADGSSVELSADLPVAIEALEAWSPGSGDDWARYLGICGSMWSASVPFLTGEPPWPPRRPGPGVPTPDPRDLLRVRPWATVSSLARSVARDPRLAMIIERFATYAGGDPRRTPAALAVAGYVEHAFGAWHVRGGLFEIVRALERRSLARGVIIEYDAPVVDVHVAGGRACGVRVGQGNGDARAGGSLPTPSHTRSASDHKRAIGPAGGGRSIHADAVVWDGDAFVLEGLLQRRRRPMPERSVSGVALLLGLKTARADLVHHEIRFPTHYHAEFDDLRAGRAPANPALYLSASCATDPEEAPPGGENLFILANAPAALSHDDAAQFAVRIEAEAALDGDVVVRGVRGPAELAAQTGAVGGAIYGAAPHGRLATLKRPGPAVRGVRGLYRVGGTAHPGGGLPLVMLSGATAARLIGPA